MCEDMHDENIIELTDEEGNKVEFEIIMTFDYKENFYVAMCPTTPFEDMTEDDVLLMRVQEEGEEDVFYPIETEQELQEVWDAFVKLYEEEDEEE